MAAFCGPALLVPMADPLMGFTDVVCVGQFASTAELSALGPATLALSFATYAFQAVQVATLALVSERLRARDQPSAQRALSTALWVALALGSLLALPLVLSPNAASAVVGATGCDAALRPLAETYVRIRAAGLPFVLATMVAQAALLAQRDSRTPACAVALGVGVNVLGNLVAVAWLGLGLAGAAGTTVLTQGAGALALAALMWRQRRAGESAVAGLFSGWRRRRGGSDDDSDSDAAADDDDDESDDPLSPPMPPLRPVPRPPTAADAAALGRTVGPLSVAYVCRNLCYLALQGAAASLDVTRLAAHQATFSCWNILSFVSSPVEQSALAFVPAAAAQAAAEEQQAEEEARRRRRQQAEGRRPQEADDRPPSSSSSSSWWRVDATVRLVLLCGLGMGLGCGALAASVPSHAPFLFTPDASVWPWMRSIAPQAFLSMVLIGVDVSCAGCLLAGRDLAYVARSYVVTLCVLWGAVLGPLKLASSLGGVWWCLVVFFAARAAQSTARLGWLMRTRGLVSRLSAAA
jgi:Na+-driven multidrug efflux pump